MKVVFNQSVFDYFFALVSIIENQPISVTIAETESVITDLPTKNSPGP